MATLTLQSEPVNASSMLQFDTTDAPPAGTMCVECKANGHNCPAKGYLGTVALCPSCGMGEPCSQAQAVQKLHAAEVEFEPEELELVTLPEPTRASRRKGHGMFDRVDKVIAEFGDATVKESGTMERMDMQLAAKIQAEPKDAKLRDLAFKYGLSPYLVKKYRSAKVPKGSEYRGIPHGELPAGHCIRASDPKKPAQPAVAATAEQKKPVAAAGTFSVQVTEEMAERMWARATAAEKCRFAEIYVAQLLAEL